MAASINYPALVDEVVLFQNLAAAQNFFDNFKVPSATTEAEGSVKQAQVINYVYSAATATDYVDIIQDGVHLAYVPNQTSFSALIAKHNALGVAFQSLLY